MKSKSFDEIRKNLKKDATLLPKIKVAVLGDCATQFFVKSLKSWAIEFNYELNVFEADYKRLAVEFINPNSDLYQFEPDYIIVFNSVAGFWNTYFKSENKNTIAKTKIDELTEWYDYMVSRSKAKLIYLNLPEVGPFTFGNYYTKVNNSFEFQAKDFNHQLMLLSGSLNNLFVCDQDRICRLTGLGEFLDMKMLVRADMPCSLDAHSYIGQSCMQIIQSLQGKVNKSLVLDLDNTMWGGVIGDDGIENIEIGDLGSGKAFTLLQLWVKDLKNRGIILNVCSKNTEEIAVEPFSKHPEMVIKMDDIAVFKANWENKASKIKNIQEILNLGMDSFVFIDDNPFERNMVKENIKEITVPDLPEDPAEYMLFLAQQNYFETASYSQGDKDRTRQYQEEANRVKLKTTFIDEDHFLNQLEMKCTVEEDNQFSIPRVSQLTQRSNQFNLRTKRYTEHDIKTFMSDEKSVVLTFELKDKFGDYGIISVVVLEQKQNSCFIDTWIMSCRVLKRSVEKFVLNEILEYANKNDLDKIIGEYLSTPKNIIVKSLLQDHGFSSQSDNRWELKVDQYKPFRHHIVKL